MFWVYKMEPNWNPDNRIAIGDQRSGPGPEGSLGNTTKKVSVPHSEIRKRRYKQQSLAGNLLPDWRVSWCMKTMVGNMVEIKHNEEHHYAYYRGVAVCGSIWVCSVCAAKVSEQRRKELRAAVAKKGYTVLLVTFTLQHELNDGLSVLLDTLNDGTRRLKQGRWWGKVREKYGLVAYVSGSEVTWGENGWHPHKHTLFFSTIPEKEFKVDEFKAEITAKYKEILARNGRYASDLYGVDVEIGDKKAGDYVGKWGVIEEVTKSPVKNGRDGGYSPFQLLDLYGEGDKRAGALFCEYAKCFEGKRQLSWSHGARQILGLGEEQEDIELASQEDGEQVRMELEDSIQTPGQEEGQEGEQGDKTLVCLNYTQWGEVLRQDARVHLLEVADSGDPVRVLDFLESIGIQVLENTKKGSMREWIT